MEIQNLRFGQTAGSSAAYVSAGLHPWHISAETLQAASDWLLIQVQSTRVIAIGEAGLDKITETPWASQRAAFQRCVEISETTKKPLIIHCVRAFHEIIALKKQWQPQLPWIFHGFNKNLQIADMLLNADCFLSFGKAIFQENNHAAAVLRQIPADRFFLETDDAPDLDIEAVYRKAAELRGCTLERLQEKLEMRFQEIFLMKM